MRSKFALGLLLAAISAGSSLSAGGAVRRTSFALTEIGNADFNAAVPLKEDDPKLVRLRSTEYGRALLLSSDYFLGEMKDLWQIFDFSVGGKASDYNIKIMFSDPAAAKVEVADGYGGKGTKDVTLLVMNATISDKSGKVVFSSNFERQTDRDEKVGSISKLVRLCFADLASLLRAQFAATYRVNLRAPTNFPEFDPSSAIVCVDGERISPSAEIWLSKGRHELKVTADGCEDVASTIEMTDHLQSSVKLKRK